MVDVLQSLVRVGFESRSINMDFLLVFCKYLLQTCDLITVRKRSCRKVKFSQASVKNSVHWGGCTPLGRHHSRHTPTLGRHPSKQTPTLGRHHRSALDGHCSGRYTSYWSPFLLKCVLVSFWMLSLLSFLKP